MEVRHSYKKTELGVIPEEWEIRRLHDLGSSSIPAIKAGPFGSSLTKDSYVPAGFKIYGQEQVIRGDYLFGDYYISGRKYRDMESCAVRPGDVLLSLVGTVGKLLVLPEDAPRGIINPRLIRFSFDKNQVCPYFFKYLFESDQTQRHLSRQAQGGTMGVLNAGMLRPMTIPVPPLPEQRAIATALSDVDALIAGLDQLIAKKRDLKQAAMQQLLTGKTRLPGFYITPFMKTEIGLIPKDWNVKKLGNCCKIFRGGSPRPIQDYITSSVNGINWIKIGDVGRGAKYIDSTEEKIIPEGVSRSRMVYRDDFLLSNSMSFGRPYILRTDGCIHDGWLVLQGIKNTFDSDYIYYLLSSAIIYHQYINMAAGSSVLNLNKYIVSSVLVIVPPIAEQTAIAEVLSDMDAEIATLETRLEKTRFLKQGMMQELLTGRIRLV